MPWSQRGRFGFIVLFALVASLYDPSMAVAQGVDYRVLATTKTSTMEKELNEAAEAGFRFQTVMGGKEVVAILRRPKAK